MKFTKHDTQLAKFLLEYSLGLKKGETVFIHTMDEESSSLVELLYRESILKGAYKIYIWWDTPNIQETFLLHATKKQISGLLEQKKEQVEKSNVYIKIKSAREVSVQESENTIYYQNLLRPITNLYANSDIRRILFYYPGKDFSVRTGISLRSIHKLSADVSYLADWKEIKKNNESLVKKLKKTKKVRIEWKRTKLEFELGNIPVISSYGKRNMPDGEVFTAPIRDSVNGEIFFDVSTHFYGITFRSVYLKIKKGKVIQAKASSLGKTKILNSILDSHKQNRYFGELGIGTHTGIKKPVGLTIFDEKMAGTIHLALGRCYTRADNGNTDATIHWDLIKDMKLPDSRMYFDEKIVLEEGILEK